MSLAITTMLIISTLVTTVIGVWSGVVIWRAINKPSCPRCKAVKRGDFCGTCGKMLIPEWLADACNKRRMPSCPPDPPPRKVGSVVWGTH